MTQLEVAQLVAMLAAAFPHARIGEKTMQVYESMLADLDHEAAKRACARLLSTAKFMPTIAEIRGATVDMEHGPRRIGAEAWGDVNDAVRRFGRYQPPAFEDPLVAECVRSFGWSSLCDSTNDTADRARFIELYDGLAARQRADKVAGGGLSLPSGDRSPQRRLEAVPGIAKIGRGPL
jgi:hypothetical protein